MMGQEDALSPRSISVRADRRSRMGQTNITCALPVAVRGGIGFYVSVPSARTQSALRGLLLHPVFVMQPSGRWSRFDSVLGWKQLGHRLAERMGATNPSGWSGVLKAKDPDGATLGYILLYTNP